MEEVINFPTSLVSHPGYHWKNLPMTPYSDLSGAVESLVERGKKVVIITGFYIPGGELPATETDGPPGSLILAEGLKFMGMEVSLLSDEYTLPTLKAGLDVLGISEKEVPLISVPMEHPDMNHINRADNEEDKSPVSLSFVRDFFDGPHGRDLTHLIYIERVGPNHTLDSLMDQRRKGKPPINEFNRILLPAMRNRCFNSKVEDITRYTGKTHFFLEFLKRRGLLIESIGIGDRGNEIGAGKIPWEVFKKHASNPRDAIMPCRVETDFFISCGISNWGGYALFAGVALALGKSDILGKVTPEQERKVLDYLIHYGPAVDGISWRQESSVDGIEFDDYMRLIERVKEITLEGAEFGGVEE
jgi:hypothetical protein